MHQPSGPLCPLIRELLLINSLHSGVLTLRSTICPGFYTPESAFWKEEARTAIYQALSMDSPSGSDSKESAYNARDLGSIPGWRRSPGEGNGHPLLYSCLENPVDRGSLVDCSPGGHRQSDTTERWTLSLPLTCSSSSPGHLIHTGVILPVLMADVFREEMDVQSI